jgi:glycosyl hydrolase family 20
MSNKIIIPTPVKCSFTGKEIGFDGFNFKNTSLPAPYALEMGHTLLKGKKRGGLVFAELKHENKQAYKITITDNEVTLAGASKIAFIYAMASLLQLRKMTGDKIILPKGEIFDYPKFKVRCINWNLLVECRGWSQDAGDGLDAFIERSVSGLDTLAFFKLNSVIIDGYGWNKERFPGYGKLMRQLHYEARRRGIKLTFGGYNAGYGTTWYDFDGPAFRNRKSYPDGKVYSCIDTVKSSKIGSTMGTCLSNKALLEEKKKNLKEFVRAVEPGMIMLHGIDISRQEEAKKSWAGRCPECRKRWPSDAINASDSMAGAYAEFYSELYEAVSSVKNPENDYDASKDCIVNMVSPNYSDYTEDDKEWKYHLDYFKMLASCVKNKNIHLMLREQFFNIEESKPRFEQLREAVGQEQKLTVFYFSSGSTFYNSLPVTADAACIKYFDGMDVVVAGSGNSFQEPRQIIYSEYMWNPKGSAFTVDLPEHSSNNDFLSYYNDLTHGRAQPEAIFGKNGLLDIVCEKLYGEEAGKLIAQSVHIGFDSELIQNPDNLRSISLAPLVPLHNDMLPGYHYSIFNKFSKIYWHQNVEMTEIEYAKHYRDLMPYIVKISVKAADNYKAAAILCKTELPLKPYMRQKHLERMTKACSIGARLAGFTQKWLAIFVEAYENIQKGADSNATQDTIRILSQELTAFVEPFLALVAKTIDTSKGDIGQAIGTIEFILNDLANINHTLSTKKYLEAKPSIKPWW